MSLSLTCKNVILNQQEPFLPPSLRTQTSNGQPDARSSMITRSAITVALTCGLAVEAPGGAMLRLERRTLSSSASVVGLDR